MMHPLTIFQSFSGVRPWAIKPAAKCTLISKWLRFQLEIIAINRKVSSEKGTFCFRSLSSSEEEKLIWMAVFGERNIGTNARECRIIAVD